MQTEPKKNEVAEERLVEDNAGLESNYVRFEDGERKQLQITNWCTVETVKTFPNKETGKLEATRGYWWKCEVVQIDNKPVQNKILELRNIQARKRLNDLLAGVQRNTFIGLSIKRIGTGAKTVYDIELI